MGVSDYSPITESVRRLFNVAKWLSPMPWLGLRFPLFRSRGEITNEEVHDLIFTQRRSRAVEYYVIAWLILEAVLVLLSCLSINSYGMIVVLTLAASIRIIEVVQVAGNTVLFDALGGRPDELVASRVRMLTLAGINFCEMIICFGVIYACWLMLLHGAGRPITAFYFSIITQLTIGYGDIFPTSWLRVVAALQGLTSLFYIVLVFGRFLASFPSIGEVSHDSDTKCTS